MPELQIYVRGMVPKPWGTNEWEWRRALAEKARTVRREEGFSFGTSIQFRVEVVFFMTEANIDRADLDNLAKPVLDTLFRTRYPQVKDLALTGALLEVDDDRVFRLSLEKKPVSTIEEEGVTVTVSWQGF